MEVIRPVSAEVTKPSNQISGFRVTMKTTAQGITLPPKHCQGWVLETFTYTQGGLFYDITCGQPGTSLIWKTDPFTFCTLSTPRVSTSPADTSMYGSDNLRNLVTTMYSPLRTIWKFHVNYSHSTSTPNGEYACYMCTCVWEPACVHNAISHITCGYSVMFWQVLALTSLLKQKGGDKTKAISFQCFCQWHSVDSTEFDGTLSEAQMLCRRQKNASMHLKHINRITERFGLERTFKDHLVQLLTCLKGILKREIKKKCPRKCYSIDTRKMIHCLQWKFSQEVHFGFY